MEEFDDKWWQLYDDLASDFTHPNSVAEDVKTFISKVAEAEYQRGVKDSIEKLSVRMYELTEDIANNEKMHKFTRVVAENLVREIGNLCKNIRSLIK